MVGYIQAGLEKLYPASFTLRKYILEKIDKKQRNLWKRIKRFKRKVNMNRWTHFVTFTCDPKKHTQESFMKKLRKCLLTYISARFPSIRFLIVPSGIMQNSQ